MSIASTRIGTLSVLLAWACVTQATFSQDQKTPPPKPTEQPAPKLDAATVRQLVEDLKSGEFKKRDRATRELSKLDEVPDALRELSNKGDLEARRRAQAIVGVITVRLEEKAFQAMLADVQKIELDRLIRRLVAKPNAPGDREWDLLQAVVRSVTKRANDLGGRQFGPPVLDPKALPLHKPGNIAANKQRVLVPGPDLKLVSVQDSVVLCVGPTPRMAGVSNSIIIVDGDFTGVTSLTNSLLIVRGNVGRMTGVRNSIILATGNFVGATVCDDSFLQVNNQRIRFTGSKNCLLVKTQVRTTGQTNSQVLETDRGPLQLLKFSARPADAQLHWGKEVNGLALAITATDQPDKILLRWKNVGKEWITIPGTRRHGDLIDRNADDLLGQVALKGPDGKLVAARKYEPPARPGLPTFLNDILLGPGQTHEEIIDVWAYVQRPMAGGAYQLSIQLDMPGGRRRLETDAKAWTGKVESNVIGLQLDAAGGR